MPVTGIGERPSTRYVRSADTHIAYQVLGDGPLDVVFLTTFYSHLELQWEEPAVARFLRRIAGFSRVIMLDQRGMGLSDRGIATDAIEERMDDVRAVLDVLEAPVAVQFGCGQASRLSALFAATYPERTQALVLYGSFARSRRDDPDYPWGMTEDQAEAMLSLVELFMTDDESMSARFAELAPSAAGDPAALQRWMRLYRSAVSPREAARQIRIASAVDIRHVLSSIRVPTLVLHRRDDHFAAFDAGRYTAEHIPGARFVELTGGDHLPWFGEQDGLLGEVEEFLTGVRPTPELDRVLATVLFTDIVDSTAQSSALGDRRWRELLDDHDDLVRRELHQFRGREINTTGDGFLATFDGPARAIRCAQAIVQAVQSLGLRVRAGLHTGECERRGDDVAGITVHIGARVVARAEPDEVLVSRTLVDLVAGSGIEFVDRGEHELKGVPGSWRLFSVID